MNAEVATAAAGGDVETSGSVGELILAGTPIGDSRYATPALREALATADLIAAEDTRRFRTLLARLQMTTPARIISFFDGNESERIPTLLAELHSGARVVVVTDAGMPAISDPGYRIVHAALAAGIRVRAIPGPSALTTALVVSGLPVDRFCFEGFPPRKTDARAHYLAGLVDEARTMVFYEAPHRIGALLVALRDAFGADRPGAVCRELTKPHEEVIRGTLDELVAWSTGAVRGEITVVVGGATQPHTDLAGALAIVVARLGEGERLSRVVSDVAELTGIRRKTLYEAALAQQTKPNPAPTAVPETPLTPPTNGSK